MVSMEVSKTLGPGSSPGTPAIFRPGLLAAANMTDLLSNRGEI